MISKDIRRILSRLDPWCARLLEGAVGACVHRTHYEVGIPHLLAQMVEDGTGDSLSIFVAAGIDRTLLRTAVQEELRGCRTGNSSRPVFAPALLELLERSWMEASLNLSLESVRAAAILFALADSPHLVPQGLQDHFRLLRPELLRDNFPKILAESAESKASASGTKVSKAGEPSESALARFTIDFTEQARQGKIDPVFGRDGEIRQAVDILSRRRKNNPLFLGEAGVGKTAVVEGIALKIAAGEVPPVLRGVRLLSLDLGLLSAGAGVRGEFENRLKAVIRETKESPEPVILFVDEAHTLIGAGGEAGKGDAANLLKPELARGELKCIAATTFSEFHRYLEKDPAIARRFQTVTIPEPLPAEAAVMLRGLRERYEEFHGVRITHEAVQAACDLSHRYIAGRQLPDKAVDLLDTAAARVRMGLDARPEALCRLDQEALDLGREIASLERDLELRSDLENSARIEVCRARLEMIAEEIVPLESRWQEELAKVRELLDPEARASRKPEEMDRLWEELSALQGEHPLVAPQVTPAVLSEVIEEWTGIPAGNLLRDEARMLLSLEDTLNQRVIGQSWGIRELAATLRASRMGLTRPETPRGVFLLAGPSGVGKTETAKAIADLLYGGDSCVVTLNMSEYQESISTTQLKGASAGYVGYGDGGVLTEGVRKRPYTVVILDEIEKAHKDVLNMFYQVFDQGSLRDGEGREVNFRDAVILMTSNLGSETIMRMAFEEGDGHTYADYTEAILPELTDHFLPALLARCKVIPYLPLGTDVLRTITIAKLDKVARRLDTRHGVELACSEGLVDHIVGQCGQVQSGARLIDAILDRDILPGISQLLLSRIVEELSGDRLTVGIGEGGEPVFRLEDRKAV